MNIRLIYAAFLLGFGIMSATGTEISFSYAQPGSPVFNYGFGTAETYDVAIRLDEPSFVGSAIKGLRVSLPGEGSISSTSGWLSKELTLKRQNGKNVNAPDIASYDGKYEDGMLTVTFDEPFIYAEPVYIGYSFKVEEENDATSEPIVLAEGSNVNGLFIHSSRTRLKWKESSGEAKGVSAMQVLLEGNFSDNCASFRNPGELPFSAEDSSRVVVVEISNHGSNALENIEYEWELGGLKGEGTIDMDSPLAAYWGESAPVKIEIPGMLDAGEYELYLTVTKVNGTKNSDPAPTVAIPVRVYPFLPVTRPLVEEYTGLWCAWCPKGYVALETMHKDYPDTFIGVAYHSDDAMDCIEMVPDSPSGYPAGYINRNNLNLPDIYSVWPQYASRLSQASVEVKIGWNDDSSTSVKAESTVCFIRDYKSSDFGISYILLIDGLSDPSWLQMNAYAPAEGSEPVDHPDMPGDFGYMFTHGTNPMAGLTYNDVALDIKYIDGAQGSIPSQIEEDTPYVHQCVFDLNEIKRQELLKQPENLRVVAVLIDRKTGKPVNCNSSLCLGKSVGVGDVLSDSWIVSTVWYNLSGGVIVNPAKGDGVAIRVDVMSDGSKMASKVIL